MKTHMDDLGIERLTQRIFLLSFYYYYYFIIHRFRITKNPFRGLMAELVFYHTNLQYHRDINSYVGRYYL